MVLEVTPLLHSVENSAFSAGRANAVVCDCGAGSTSAVPIVEGYALNKATWRSPRGGQWLDEQVGKWLQSHKITVKPLR